jgi:hypothetical protein
MAFQQNVPQDAFTEFDVYQSIELRANSAFGFIIDLNQATNMLKDL